MRLLYLLFLLPFGLVAQPSAQVMLHDTTRFLSVGRQTTILEDQTARLSFGQVRGRTDFVPSQSERFQFGYTRSAYWFRFQLANQSRENIKHWLLGVIDVATLDYVDLYLVYPDGRVVHQTGGLKRPYVDQGFFSITPFFRVELPANKPVTAYLRLESTLHIYGRLSVWDEYYNLSKGRFQIFAIWTFLGLFILRSLTNFVLARFITDRQFRLYALCTFLLYVSTLSRAGIFPIVFVDNQTLLDWLHYGINRLLPLGLAAWVYTLLDSRPAFRPLRWLLVGIMGLSAIGSVLPFFMQTAAIGQFYSFLVLLMYALFFGSVILMWVVGPRPKLHFVGPITLCMIPFMLYQAQLAGIIAYRPVYGLLVLLALAVEMVSVSLVLGQIVQSYILERLVAAKALMREKIEVDKLQELDLLKTRFFTNISHEFRTPLTLILGPLNNRKNKPMDEPELSMMERNGNRLMTLINQLLDLSKLEAGELRAEPEPGDMAAFFRTLAASFESLADSRAIRFGFNQNQDRYWAIFDRDKLEKITTNLLSNAFKFTSDSNEVRMDVTYLSDNDTGARVRLVVADTGIGIAPDHLPRIFDRFYQRPPNASTGYYEGTGIGLALVQELVRILTGTVAVESTERQTDGSGGTIFRIELPLLPAAAPTEPQTPLAISRSVAAPDAPSIPASVLVAVKSDETADILLIIDDSADIRAYVRSVFEADYQIIDAIDSQQGLEVATAITPNLVICDLMMPRLDGFGFCRALKTQEATSHIPVVMLTAKATLEDRIEGFGLGADDYLTKPFNADELRVRVRNLLDKQERLRLHFGKTVIPVPASEAPTVSREDVFLQKARELLEKHLGNSGFGVDEFSREMGLSQSQLLRKLKALTGLTAVEFVRQYRLERAALLLAGRAGNVSEIAYLVGFESLPYFTKVFQEKYGVVPSEYGV